MVPCLVDPGARCELITPPLIDYEASRRKKKGNMDALKAPLQAYIGWQIGTGPLERSFSQHQRLFASSRRGCMMRQREQDIMTLISDHDTAEVDKVLRLAIEIWKQFFTTIVRRGKNAE